MSNPIHNTAAVSETEILIRNLQASGFSEQEIHYEMTGYGCERTFARMFGYEQATDSVQEAVDR